MLAPHSRPSCPPPILAEFSIRFILVHRSSNASERTRKRRVDARGSGLARLDASFHGRSGALFAFWRQLRNALAAANKWRVLVVEFAREMLRAWACRIVRGASVGDESYLADDVSSPGLINPGAELALQFLKLLLPCLAVGGDLETAPVASHRARARGERFANDGRPRSDEPREGGFGVLEPAECAA
jgi:hypothetical protein